MVFPKMSSFYAMHMLVFQDMQRLTVKIAGLLYSTHKTSPNSYGINGNLVLDALMLLTVILLQDQALQHIVAPRSCPINHFFFFKNVPIVLPLAFIFSHQNARILSPLNILNPH